MPFIMQLKGNAESLVLLVGVWLTSAIGVAIELRLSILLYPLLNWSGVMAYGSIYRRKPDES
jgi:hemolysin III